MYIYENGKKIHISNKDINKIQQPIQHPIQQPTQKSVHHKKHKNNQWLYIILIILAFFVAIWLIKSSTGTKEK